ncbi:MAG: restriction endonuclease [Planctomycetota bacterium]|jgi:site-specific DNA-methyltransferase (adenine-specific)|nr:restriction endonuclease [Planctomycetota bacterium]
MPNRLFYGDNLEVLQKYIADESVDLCYVDPPFNSNRNYNQIYNNVGADDVAQSQAFVDTWGWGEAAETQLADLKSMPRYTHRLVKTVLGFENILGKGSMLAYLVNMATRFVEIWRALKPSGSFYVHCDPTVSHYLKILLDAIFCDRGGDFRNEIIWCYKSRPQSKKYFGKKHDSIFFYTKSDNYTFNWEGIARPLAAETVKKYRLTDDAGRRYRLEGRGITDSPIRSAKDVDPQWETTHPEWVARDYLDEKKGVAQEDWWLIDIINQAAKERLGYPTQKPLALLERIIKASSNAGDTVLDAFCGCGTTVDAAQSLGRKWIGVDITYNSVSLIQKRLIDRYGEKVLGEVQLSGIPQDLAAARALAQKQDDRLRKEFEKWAILTYANNQAKINDKKGADGGIDGVAYTAAGTALFSVKSGAVSVKDVRDLRGVLDRENAAAGILITLNEPTKNMLQEASAAGFLPDPPTMRLPQKTPKIQIVSIQQMLDGARLNLPLPVPVFKSAARARQKNHQAEIGFEEN